MQEDILELVQVVMPGTIQAVIMPGMNLVGILDTVQPVMPDSGQVGIMGLVQMDTRDLGRAVGMKLTTRE
ncbi:MAG: hypothetical protein JWM11_4649 [Planctomycetaceae bacterium]|nr:hypothetical protein [Planctomycetaceae bacterium]